MLEFIGRFHPVLVHLPIGILLLAFLFEVLGRRERWTTLQPAVPFILMLGAVAAGFSCITGWLLSRSGEYESDLVNRHQWLGIGVAIISFSAYWLKIKRFSKAYTLASLLLMPGILLTGHWGMSLTHGESYLTTSGIEETEEEETAATATGIPDIKVSPPSTEAMSALRKEGVVVLPLGKDQPFLSLNFVNVVTVTPAMRKSMESLQENVIWLKWTGMALNDSTLSLIPGFQNLTRLSLDHTNIGDASLVHLQQSKRLVYLNLVGTNVSSKGLETLGGLPDLRQLFLYQTGVTTNDTAVLRTKLPHVQIDLGGYQVPVLPTDTAMLPVKK